MNLHLIVSCIEFMVLSAKKCRYGGNGGQGRKGRDTTIALRHSYLFRL
jgi:hypothetical protein